MSRPMNRQNLTLVAVLIGTFLTATGAWADSIVLKGATRLDADRADVRLADVATLSGPYAKTLGAEIVLSWDGQGLATVTVSDIREMLSDRQVNWGRLSLSGTECVVRPLVRRDHADQAVKTVEVNEEDLDHQLFASEIIHEATLRGEVARLLSSRIFDESAENLRIKFREADAEPLARGTDRYQFEITPASTGNSTRIPLNIRVFENGRLVDSFRLKITVLIRMNVVIVDRTLRRGDLLTTDILHTEERFMEPHPDAPFRSLPEVLGQEAQGRLIVGQVLRASDVASLIAVRRRSRVIVTAIINSFAIKMTGRAREDGRVGDVIRVIREPDRLEMLARIEPSGELVLVGSQ